MDSGKRLSASEDQSQECVLTLRSGFDAQKGGFYHEWHMPCSCPALMVIIKKHIMKNALWVLALVLSSTSLMAEVGISNLGDISNTNSPLTYGVAGPHSASSFTVGPVPEDLTNITIAIDNTTGTADTIGLSLYSDFFGIGPATLLNSLGSDSTSVAAASPSNEVNLSYSLSSPVALNANSTYWVVTSGGSNENWYASSGATTGLPGWSMGASDIYLLGKWFNNGLGEPNQMSVEVTPVPEPSAAALSCIGFLLLSGSVYKRRKA